MKKLALLGSFMLFFITNSWSQSIIRDLVSSNPDFKDTLYPIDRSFKQCDSTWRTNIDWGACLGKHIRLWEIYMKQTYDTLIGLADTTGQRIVKNSQDSWQKSFDGEKDLSNYIMDLPEAGFGREDNFKRYYSELYEVRSRAIELESCLAAMRFAKERAGRRK